jgi:hypothetical protein
LRFCCSSGSGLVASSWVTGGSYAGGDKSVVSANQVRKALKAAQSITQVPADRAPKLSNLSNIEVLDNGDCPADYTAPHVGIDELHFGECTYGDPSGARPLDVFGDGLAGTWLTAIRYAAERAGWRVRIFYFPACPPRISRSIRWIPIARITRAICSERQPSRQFARHTRPWL